MMRKRDIDQEKEIMVEKSDHCDTELCLSPCGLPNSRPSPADRLAGSSSRDEPAAKGSEEHHRQITILYGGRMCVCDVTEVQARSIICMARREMQDMEGMKHHIENNAQKVSTPRHMARSLSMPTESTQLLNRGLSMKRSLQLFLEKRKTRAVDSSPYNSHEHGQHHHTPQ